MAKNSMKPKIRFKGFTEAWEQRKLGEIAPLRGGFSFKSTEYVKNGIPIVRISNILSNGNIGADFAYYSKQDNDGDYTLSDGAVLLAMSGATTGKVAILHASKTQKYYQNQRVGYFVPTTESDYGFVSVIVRSRYFSAQLDSVLVAGAQPNVSARAIDSFEFSIPVSQTEQKSLGQYFNFLDNLISLHQRKYEKLVNIKKALLEKMFPQGDEKVPRIRFKGFTDAWEQRKFGDILQTLPFKQFLKEPEIDGKYEVIQQGGEPVIGFANGTPCTDYKDIVIFGDHTLSLYKPKQPFFVATDGVRILKGTKNVDGFFLLSLLERYKPQSEGYKRYFNILANIECFTSYNISEQKKIGAYFDNLDNLITLHQRQVEKLKNIKSALLEKVFV